MKALLFTYVWRALAFGLVMMLIGFFNGGVRYGDGLAPIWFQLLRLFAIYAVVFLVVEVAAAYASEKVRRRKKE